MARTASHALIAAIVIVSGLFHTLPAQAQKSQDWLWCENKDDGPPDRQIRGCTAVIESGRETRPQLAIAFNNRGIALLARKELDRAIADYDEAIRLLPNADYAYNNRGNAWLEKKNLERAMADYEKAISLNPNNAKAYNNRGKIFAEKKDYDRALLDYERAIRLVPGYANAFFNRGNVWRDKHDRDRAIADYSEAIRLDPADAPAYVNRGNQAYEADDFDKAVADYSLAIKLDPAHPAAHFLRANAWAGKRAYDQAMTDYNRAIELDAGNAAAYRFRGFVRFNLGDFANAAADLQRGALGPADAYAALWLHLARLRAGVQDTRNELSLTAAQLPATAWPRPVMEFFLGRQPLESASAAATTPERRCEASFYVGQWHLLQGAQPTALRALQEAADTCPKSFIEYRGAVAELSRIKQ